MIIDKRAYLKLRSIRTSLIGCGMNEASASNTCFCIVFGLVAEANYFFLGKPLTQLLIRPTNLGSEIREFFEDLELDFLPECRLPGKISAELRYKLADLCTLDWKECSPSVIGALFELAATEDTKTERGIFYTSKRNIHRCIDPLIIDGLLDRIEAADGNREQLLTIYQDLSEITVLDPACGSGNYLIEVIAALRNIETQLLVLLGEQPYRVDHRRQIFGIEIEEQSAKLCRAAIFLQNRICDRLAALTLDSPLKPTEQAAPQNILCVDSLAANWNAFSLKPLTYIIGNPPFSWKITAEQREAMQLIFDNDVNSLDYSAAWVRKAAYCCKQGTKAALLTTSSICQGRQVYPLWSEIFRDGAELTFAYKPFKWTTDYDEFIPPVWTHCVILGLSSSGSAERKYIYTADDKSKTDIRNEVRNINGYLLDMPSDFFVKPAEQPLCLHPQMLSDREHNEYITDTRYQELKRRGQPVEKYIPYIRAKDSLYGINNYTERTAEIDLLYPVSDYIVVWRHSSSKRQYVPILYFSNCQIVCSESVYYIADADLYTYGLMCSLMHNVWIACTCGRLDNNLRYSISLTYNTFPVPDPTEEQKQRIISAAKELLEEQRRCLENSCMADIYDDMPMSLKAAHMKLDLYVDKLYSDRELFGEQQRFKLLADVYTERMKNKCLQEKVK